MGWALTYFSEEQNFSTANISKTFCRSATKFGKVGGLANRNLFPGFRKLRSGVPWYHATTCINVSLVYLWIVFFLENFPIFADSFSVLSIHCIARGLAASFLYKCPASRRAVVPCGSTAFLYLTLSSYYCSVTDLSRMAVAMFHTAAPLKAKFRSVTGVCTLDSG